MWRAQIKHLAVENSSWRHRLAAYDAQLNTSAAYVIAAHTVVGSNSGTVTYNKAAIAILPKAAYASSADSPN
jgi:hypothetical protein